MLRKPDILSDRDDCRNHDASDEVVVRMVRERFAGGLDDDWEYVAERDDPWIDEALADVDVGNCVTHAEAKLYLEEVVREIDLENRRASRAR
jgi:hypothetical protein